MKKLATILCVVVTIVTMAVPAFAYTTSQLPAADTVWTGSLKETYPYAIVYNSSETQADLYLCMQKPSLESTVVRVTNYARYQYTGGDGWVKKTSAVDSIAIGTYDRVIETSENLIDSSGNTVVKADGDFFLTPLAEVVQVTTDKAMETVIPQLGGTMMTLVVCGVGCLALLVVLKLFGKRSLIFRS